MARRTATVAVEKVTAAYLRISIENKGRNGHGLDVQEEKCTVAAKLKDLTPPQMYVDENVSGTIEPGKRPSMSKLLEDVSAGKVSTVIVYSLDRIGRRARDILEFVYTLNEKGVELYVIREGLDTSTPHGRFALTIMAAVAELDRDYISLRTKAALDKIRSEGKYAGGGIPYGYTLEDGELYRNENYPIARRIVRMHDEGLTMRAIADILNSENIPPPGKGAKAGKEWYGSSVNTILKNRRHYATE